ncbi:cellulase family glycosylhydrolase [Acuticoccus sp.]|uniref:cellulase family glycosylhydrolase n=1 Tax=Acuticoccus sp. TaxID=1904378 RepID=UPI003B52062E
MADTAAEATLESSVRERWDGGAVIDVTLTAADPLAGWRVELDAGGEIVELWNAIVLEATGTRYVLGPAPYNQLVAAGTAVAFGLKVDGSGPFELLGSDVELAAEAAARTAQEPPSAVAEAPDPATEPQEEASEAPHLPSITVGPVTVAEPTGASDARADPAPTPYSVRGAAIVDATGRPVTIHGLNWFGLETDIFVPHGLWARNWRELMDEVDALGFTTLRLPFSGELVASGGGTPSGIDFALNPDLEGLDGLQILDAIADYAETVGLRILFDYHRGTPGGGPNENGLWYGDGRTEADVIAEWQAMAERYGDHPAVIGADLINEPHLATWGDGSATDWAAAAERIGEAVLDVAPHWLIVVEGVAVHDGDAYWWGGNLQGVRERPVRLSHPDKLVYSAHDYPPSVHEQPWFETGRPLEETWRKNWGYLVEGGVAPVLLGEWGGRLATPADQAWADALSSYMTELDLPWMWWSLNPNSRDTGGLFEDDWRTLRDPVAQLLEPFLVRTREDDPAGPATVATFTVTLEAPADADLYVKYATADGTAKAGEDYVATAGTLDFAAGERVREVAVPVLPDAVAEGDEYFYLVVSAQGAQRALGTAVVAEEERDRRPAGPPTVDVANALVPDGAGAARFRVVLSEPSTRDVTVDYRLATNDGAVEALGGTLVVPSGEREATLEVPVEDGTGRLTLELTGADGATIRGGSAQATVASGSAGTAGGAVPSPDATQLAIDLILENDWGDGALFNVVLRNTSEAPVAGWTLSLELPFDVAEVWSAHLAADEGARVTFQNTDWNGAIAPGEAVGFGFVADAGGIALGALLAGADVELAIQ